MHKIFTTNASYYGMRLKQLLLDVPGTEQQTEEGLPSNMTKLSVLGASAYIENGSGLLYITKEKTGYYLNVAIDEISHIYFSDKHISVIRSNERTHVFTLLKDGEELIGIDSGNIYRRAEGQSASIALPSFISRPTFLRPMLNSLYVSDFCAPRTDMNYLGQRIWYDSREPITENLKVFHGHANIQRDQTFLVGDQEWLCLFKNSDSDTSFLGLKKE